MSTLVVNDARLTVSFPSSLHPLDVSVLSLLANTNDAPDDIQRISLETTLAHRTSDINVLYQTLEDCKRLHLRLQQGLLAAKDDVRSIKSVIHPVRVLPHELLREIFVLGWKGGFNACVSTTDNLWRWAQVCRQWRDVCLGIPSFWSDIRLDFVSNASLHLSSGSSSSRHALCVLDKCISCCLGRPIDVTIMAPRLHIAGNPLLNCIICRCAQWRTFSMDAPEDVWHSLNTCAESLHKLNHLDISNSYHGSMAETVNPAYANSILSSFSFVPILRSLSIADVPLHALSLSPTTIHNLDTLCIHLYKQSFAVLELLPRMCSLRCLDVTCNASVRGFKRTLELPTVTSLTLRDGDSSDGLPLVWSLLHLDNLREMSLCYEGTISNPAWPRLSSPVYSITLFTLFYTDSVAEFDYHDEASIMLMRCFPNLETLLWCWYRDKNTKYLIILGSTR